MIAKLRRVLSSQSFALASMALLCGVFWIHRIVPAVGLGPLGGHDLNNEVYPTLRYGFEVLRAGHLPLWNPFQHCGTPFLAVPYSALFYPPNLVYLFSDTALGIEISSAAHMIFAAWSLWALVRLLGMPQLPAVLAGLTYAFAGSVVGGSGIPGIHAARCWLPATILAVELVIRSDTGRREWLAPVGLALALTLQVLNGATEFLVFNFLVAGAYAGFRLGRLARVSSLPVAARRALLLLGCIAVGIGLSAFQLLPTLELVGLSERAKPTSLEESLFGGTISGNTFLREILSARGYSAAGILAIPASILAFGVRRQRSLYLFCLAMGSLAALLVLGGRAYELFHLTPFGAFFRRPDKLMYVVHFCLSLLVAIATTRVVTDRDASIGPELRSPAWLAAIVCLAGGSAWLILQGDSAAYGLAATVLGIGVLLLASSSWRAVALVGLVMLHVASLYGGNEGWGNRPIHRASVMNEFEGFLHATDAGGPQYRTYTDPRLLRAKGLTPKQGMLQRIRFVDDYNPLTSRRHRSFLERVGRDQPLPGDDARLGLLDLASALYYVTLEDSPLQRRLDSESVGGARALTRLVVVSQLNPNKIHYLWRRRTALPRAYFVSSSREFASSDALLDALTRDDFRPREEVLLEREAKIPQVAAAGSPRHSGTGTAQIISDDAEHVEVVVDATSPGYLVLTDSFYPGWEARIDGEEIPIRRANYLFRAVAVDAGNTLVAFDYRPQSLRRGLIVSATTLMLAPPLLYFARRRQTDAARGV